MGETQDIDWKPKLDSRINDKKEAVSKATKLGRDALLQHKNDIMIDWRDANFDFLKHKIPQMKAALIGNKDAQDALTLYVDKKNPTSDAYGKGERQGKNSYVIALFQALLYAKADDNTRNTLSNNKQYGDCNCGVDGYYGVQTLLASANVVNAPDFHGVMDETFFAKLIGMPNIPVNNGTTDQVDIKQTTDQVDKNQTPVSVDSQTVVKDPVIVDNATNVDTSAKKVTSAKVEETPTRGFTPPTVESQKPVVTKQEQVVTKQEQVVTKQDELDNEFDADDGTVDAPITLTNPEQITLPEAVAVADKKRIEYVKTNIIALIDQTMTQKIDKNFKEVLQNMRQSLVDNKIDAKGINAVAKRGIENQLKNETVAKLQNKKNKPFFESFSAQMKQIANEGLNKPVYTFEMQEAERFTELDKKLEGHKSIAESIEKNNVSLLQKVEKEQQSYVENVTKYNALAITRGTLKQAIEGFTDNNRDNNERNKKYKELFECVKNMGLIAQEMQKNLIKVAIYQGKSSELSTIPESISAVITDLKSTDSLLQNASDKNAINTLVTQLENIKTKGVRDAENIITQLTSRADAKNTDIMEQVTNTPKTQTAVLNTIKVGLVGNMWLENMKEGDGFITPLEKTEKVAQNNITQWTEILKTKKDTQESNDKKVFDDNNNVITSKNDALTRAITEDQNIFTQADTKITESWKAIAEATKKEPIDAAIVKTNQGIIDEQSKVRSEKKQRINEHYFEKQLLIQQKNHSELLKVDADINATIALLEVKEKQNTSLQKKSESLGRQIQFIEDEANKLLRSPTSYENPDDNVNTQAIKRLDTQFTALKEEKEGIDKQVVVLTGEIDALKVKRDEQIKVNDVYKTASEFIGLNAQLEITTARIDGLSTERNALKNREEVLIVQKKGIDDQIAIKQKFVNDIGKVSLSDTEKRAQVTNLSKEIGALTKDSNAIKLQLEHINDTIIIIDQELDPYTKRLDGDKNDMQTAKKKLEDQDAIAFKNVDNCYTPVYTPEQIAYPAEQKPTLEEEKKE